MSVPPLAAYGAASGSNIASAGSSPAVVPKVFAKVYGNWVYRCVQVTPRSQGPVTQCAVLQQMVLNQNGHALPLITLALAKVSGQPGYVINTSTPLGILLPPGVSFWSDNNAPVNVTLDFCQSDGCVALRRPAAGLPAELRSGKQGHVKLILIDGRVVTINFSLNGAAQALTALDSGVPPAREILPGPSNVPASKPAS